jgi:uncharacterized membrane protein
MVFTAALLVLLSGLIHATWNLFTKRSIHKNAFLWYCQLVAIVVFLPWLIIDLQSASFTPQGVLLLFVSASIHAGYVLLLAQAYKVGDLSQAYPIMRGTSPLLVPIAGVLAFGESIAFYGIAGIVLILIGIVLINDKFAVRNHFKITLYALGVGCCIAAYTIIDKWTLHFVTPTILNEASNIGNLIALSFFTLKSDMLKFEWTSNKRFILLSGVLAPTGYLLFLFSLDLAPVSMLAPMREIGTVFGTIFGIVFLKERHGIRRLWAALIITAGILLLGMFG